MPVPLDSLAKLADLPDSDIDLARSALLISQLFQLDLKIEPTLERLDFLTEMASARVSADVEPFEQVAALNRFLFDEIGFSGNQDDFYNPANSFLDQVLERRLGIPITLALVYVLIAQRLGIPAFGVGFPGHFLVRVGRGSTALMLDAYSNGLALSEEELDQRLADIYGDDALTVRSHPALLRPARKIEILQRMLRNLVGVYRSRHDQAKLLEALSALLALDPNDVDGLHERGKLYRDLGYLPAARTDLKRFSEVSDDAEQVAAVMKLLEDISTQPMRLH